MSHPINDIPAWQWIRKCTDRYLPSISRRTMFTSLIGTGLLVFFFAVGFLDNYTIPVFFGLNASSIDPSVLLVTIDSSTLDSKHFKRIQDLNRCDYATFLHNIALADPKVVGVDIIFDQASSDPTCDRKLLDTLKEHPNIIIGTEYLEGQNSFLKNLFGQEDDSLNIGYVNVSTYEPLNPFPFTHSDTRNIVPVYDHTSGSGSVLPLAMEVYRRARDLTGAVTFGENFVDLGGWHRIPMTRNGFLVNFFSENDRTNDYEEMSFTGILNDNFDKSRLAGRVVFVGATAEDAHDFLGLPLASSSSTPGVFFHINFYNTLSSGRSIAYPGILAFLAIHALLLAVFYTALVRVRRIGYAVAFSVLIEAGFVGIAGLLFWLFGYYINILPSVIGLFLVNFLMYLQRYLDEKHSKDAIRTMFSRYISSDVVDELIRTGSDQLGLGGHEAEVTVFFSDIAGFTDMCEKLQPEETGRILNIYLDAMSSIILHEKGTIDKFIGDAIMAFWNAPLLVPDHADRACTAALVQRGALDTVRRAIRDLGYDSPIDIRIGINTGNVILGNFGSSQRYDYTILGDTVNLSSRLESINKQYGTGIIISHHTYDRIDRSRYTIRELDHITVKGKKEPIRIYELMGFAEDIDTATTARIRLYSQALAHYYAGRFTEALALFARVGDRPSRVFVERCAHLLRSPPEGEWKGIFEFSTK